jgi:hypothetical protein
MKLVPTILSAAALAIPASSILLPPTAQGLVIDEALYPSTVLELDCPRCPYAVGEKDGQYTWAQDAVDSTLVRLIITLQSDRSDANLCRV